MSDVLTAAQIERAKEVFSGPHESWTAGMMAVLEDFASNDHERLLRFAGRALAECHTEFCGDWDGGAVQDAMLACGLLERVERVVPCGREDAEDCPCAEVVKRGERTECLVMTQLGEKAYDAFHEQRKQIGRSTRSGLAAPDNELKR